MKKEGIQNVGNHKFVRQAQMKSKILEPREQIMTRGRREEPLSAGGGALVVVKLTVSEYGPCPASLLAKMRNS